MCGPHSPYSHFTGICYLDTRGLTTQIIETADKVTCNGGYNLDKNLPGHIHMAYTGLLLNIWGFMFEHNEKLEQEGKTDLPPYNIREFLKQNYQGSKSIAGQGNKLCYWESLDEQSKLEHDKVRIALWGVILDVDHLACKSDIYYENVHTLAKVMDSQVKLHPLVGSDNRFGASSPETRIDPMTCSVQDMVDYARYLYWSRHFNSAMKVEDLPMWQYCQSYTSHRSPSDYCNCPADYWLLKLKFCHVDLWGESGTFQKEWEAWLAFIVHYSCHMCKNEIIYRQTGFGEDVDVTCRMQKVLLEVIEGNEYLRTKAREAKLDNDHAWPNCFERMDNLIEKYKHKLNTSLKNRKSMPAIRPFQNFPAMTEGQAQLVDHNYSKLAMTLTSCFICDLVGYHHDNDETQGPLDEDFDITQDKVGTQVVMFSLLRDLETRLYGTRFLGPFGALAGTRLAKLKINTNTHTSFFTVNVTHKLFKTITQLECKVKLSPSVLEYTAFLYQKRQVVRKKATSPGKKFLLDIRVISPNFHSRHLSMSENRRVYFTNRWTYKNEGFKPAMHVANDLDGHFGLFQGNYSKERWWAMDCCSAGFIQPMTLGQQFVDNTMVYPQFFWRFFNRTNLSYAHNKERYDLDNVPAEVSDPMYFKTSKSDGQVMGYKLGVFTNQKGERLHTVLRSTLNFQGVTDTLVASSLKDWLYDVKDRTKIESADNESWIDNIKDHTPFKPITEQYNRTKDTEDEHIGDGVLLIMKNWGRRHTRLGCDPWHLQKLKTHVYGLCREKYVDEDYFTSPEEYSRRVYSQWKSVELTRAEAENVDNEVTDLVNQME